MKHLALLKTLLIHVPLLLVCTLIVVKLLGAAYWWFGIALAQVLSFYLNETYFFGMFHLHHLGTSRVETNLSAAGFSKPPFVYPFQIRFAVFIFALSATFLYVVRADVTRGLQEINAILQGPEELLLRVEHPAWTDTPPTEIVLSKEGVEISAEDASYIEIQTRNLKRGQWKIVLDLVPEGKSYRGDSLTQMTVNLGQSAHNWGQAAAHLHELFNTSPEHKAILHIKATEDSGREVEKGRLILLPEQLPIVTIQPKGNNNGELSFAVSVESPIPLSLVEIQTRTKSGYRFSKTVAEFAGSSEFAASQLAAKVNTLGIPFTPHDSLFVRATAHTVVPGKSGNSREIEIPIRSRQEVRTEIAAKLELALQSLQNDKEAFEKSKAKVEELLADTLTLADALGRQSATKRRLTEALKSADKMRVRKDQYAKNTQNKIHDVLESLKRAEAKEQALALVARLQNLASRIPTVEEQDLPKLSSEASAIAREAGMAHRQLSEMVEGANSGLNPDEKTASQNLLKADETANKTSSAVPFLERKDGEKAKGVLQQALEDARNKLMGAAQLLAAAKQRLVNQAKEALSAADNKLHESNTLPPSVAQPKIKAAEDNLKRSPKVNKEFNEALDLAQEEASKAEEGAKGNDGKKMQAGIEQSQEGIVRALEALQDEEQEQREQQQNMESAERRSTEELLSSQGQLDAGWRKRILAEIARLRASGEASDSPLLKYMESKLK